MLTAGWKNTFPCEKTLSQGLLGVTQVEKLREPKRLGCGRNTANSESGILTLCQAA